MLLALCGTLLAAPAAQAAGGDPHEWLDRMTIAVETTNYEGTVIRISDGRAEALKVLHMVSDGVVREKLIAQEGDGLEIIRNGNEVHCILPERKSVLVEAWNDQSTLFSTLPSSDIRFGNEYDVAIVREDRVAGHKTVLIAIRPHDEFRFGHRIWLDLGTGFPLQTQLIDAEGRALEQVKFADITLDKEILASDLAPSYSIENFKWYNQPRRKVTPVVESPWGVEDFPVGFRVISMNEEVLPGSDEVVSHILFSDGLANVSVFIAARDGKNFAETSKVGASNSFSTLVDGYRVTAVGEVPAATVERFAKSTRLR
jgi:sigma-E factor negative regulatory protein RseB